MSENLKQFIESRQIECKEAYEALSKMGAWDGWYKTLSSLYPDNAHFVFELLQNAEDANATMVKFELDDGSLSFKHDGTRDFNEDDVYSITNVGDSKKGEETNKIGKFGVGFKSVFAYTTSPKIYSKTISFEIEHLFIPSLIDPEPIRDGYTTVFNFPFDREDKSKADAFSEIKALFDELGDNVLLFLTNIQIIKWQVANSKIHQITKEVSDKFIEINNSQKGTSHWLVFRDQVEFNDQPLTVSVAYSYNKEKNVIEPIRGDVSIFFPAKKETSKLKFHIDAPFASTVARDSIVESSENYDIMASIATLCRESIHKIKEQGLLKLTFFEVLPNAKDELDEFYQPIIEGLLDEFNTKENKLIPLKDGSFGSINGSVYCSKSLGNIITDKNDMYILFNKKELDGLALNPGSDSRFKDFLSSLDGLIEYEDCRVFDAIYNIASTISNNFINETKDHIKLYEAESDIARLALAHKRREWLEDKSNEYMQKFYAFLYDAIEQYSRRFGIILDGESVNYADLYHLIKLSNETYNYGRLKCYFFGENSKLKEDLSFAHPKIFSLGKNKKSHEKSKALLEKIGVEDVDESTHIEYLFFNYIFVSQLEHLKDINKLVSWFINEQKINPNTEVDLVKIDLNKESFVYSENKKLVGADEIYIDAPYQQTGLKYIAEVNENNALHPMYQKLENTSVFIDILTRLNAQNSLQILRSEIIENPDWKRLWRDSQGRVQTHTGVQEDWNIEELTAILQLDENRFEISRLIWDTVSRKVTVNQLSAKFQMSQSYNPVSAKSTLIFNLMAFEWIPDKNGNFHKPEDVNEEMLAEELSFESASVWLDAVDFGRNSLIQKKEYKQNQAALAQWNISKGMAEEIKTSGLTEGEFLASIREGKAKKLKDSLARIQGSGNTPEVKPFDGPESEVFDPKGFQNTIKVNIDNPPSGVSGSPNPRSPSTKDTKNINDIRRFLRSQYNGHCQICGDTFRDSHDQNVFEMYSMNRSKKGDVLKSDFNRPGNSLSLCPKHHKIFDLELPNFTFLEALQSSKITQESIASSFEIRDYVADEEDEFYNMPEGSGFYLDDALMLPIKVFNETLYIKFSKEHKISFIVVWNEK